MKLLVVGANGGLGRQVVAHSLERGHQVTALVRRDAGQAETPGLRSVEGAVGDDLAAVRRAVDGQDAIVSALGNPLWLKARTGSAVMARAAANLTAAMHLHQVRRIAMPLAWGSGASRQHTAWPLKALTRLLIRRDYQDFDTAEAILAASGLDRVEAVVPAFLLGGVDAAGGDADRAGGDVHDAAGSAGAQGGEQ
ncbi:NAD(P)-dependent oxidoreductase [Streptomyces milbemycinicus]|uniref:NAD(P)-dependent oxidoreductase n=1 Tax=Streptomyces milbemycinicus TaxID=476552 RepID=A0ABW8LVT1_9ACTN